MKHLLLLGLVLLTFCSCAKNYPKMVEDKVEQYKKEGKFILSQSNDSTGKEHYIVYADVKQQIIGVDDLEDAVKEIHLGKLKEKFLTLKVIEGKGLTALFQGDSTWTSDWYLDSKGLFVMKGIENEHPVDMFFKDKFLTFTQNRILFFDKPDAINGIELSDESASLKVDDKGNIHCVACDLVNFAVPDKWEQYLDAVDTQHSEMIFSTISSRSGSSFLMNQYVF